MNKFIDRQSELKTLEQEYLKSSSSFVIVYGRRRVGKTSLISHFLKSHKDNIYFLATEESEIQNLKYFKMQVAEFTGNELLKTADVDWYTVFKYLVEHKTESKKVIVMDEFQYIGESNKAFPSILQKVWDTLLKDSDVMLILCGSLISLIKEQTLEYSSPLYGRRTAQIKLKQIPFKYYHDFYNGKSEVQLLPFYAVTGGVPKYIESFTSESDIMEGIENSVLNSQSYLYEEPYFLLQKEVTEIGSYFSLIRAIAMGKHKLSEIAASLEIKQTSLTKYLKVLIDLDLIEREVPVTETYPEKSKSGLYKITDNFITFWFKFIYPYRAYLEKGEIKFVKAQIAEKFIQNHLSYVYEDVCRDKMWELSANQSWNFTFDKVGRYWGSKTFETDIVAIDSVGKNLVLGECKYSSAKKGLDVLHDLQKREPALKTITSSEHVEYIIFSASGFTDALINEAKENKLIKLVTRGVALSLTAKNA